MCMYDFLLKGKVHQFLEVVYDRVVSYDGGLGYQPALNKVKRDSSSWALVLSLSSMYLLSFFFFIYAFIFRGKAEGAKSLLDLSIIVCRTSPGTSSPKPHSLVFHSKRQVKANVSCNAILEEGSYMIGTLLISRKVKSGPFASRWCYMGRFANTIYSATQRHSIAMLQQCCNHSKQCRNNVVMLCCAKNRRCESSSVTSPLLTALSLFRTLDSGLEFNLVLWASSFHILFARGPLFSS